MISNIDLAKKLLEWNTKNLITSSDLTKDKIATIFADSFQVKANGRSYDANLDNYFEFLNQFRSTIKSINYDCHHYLVDNAFVVIPMTAHVVRTTDTKEDFEAILILKFNHEGKVILWHEVYVLR